MTSGSPARLILLFCLPILAGNVLQQLYNLVDSLIIGQVEGMAALAAVSSSGWLDWGVLSIAMGLSEGFAIEMSQRFGARDYDGLKRTVGQSVLVAIAALLLLEMASQVFLRPLLRLMKTPEETFELTCTYLRFIFGGMPFVIGFNMLSGFLRSVGDSRTPLYAMISAAVSNILLDLLLVGVFRMGVAGAAIATVAAQGISCVIDFVALSKLEIMHFSPKKDMVPDGRVIKRLLSLSLPVSFQNMIISIGGIVLQTVVNSYGFIFMSGYATSSRLQGVVEIGGTAIGSAMCTFAGQNMGAGNMKRVREGMHSARIIVVLMTIVTSSILLIFGKPLLSLFINDEPEIVEQVLQVAYRFLTFMAAGLIGLNMLFIHRSTLQGLGNTVIPMASGILELFMRVGCALLLPKLIGVTGVYISEIAAWIGAGIFLIVEYVIQMRKIEKRMAKT